MGSASSVAKPTTPDITISKTSPGLERVNVETNTVNDNQHASQVNKDEYVSGIDGHDSVPANENSTNEESKNLKPSEDGTSVLNKEANGTNFHNTDANDRQELREVEFETFKNLCFERLNSISNSLVCVNIYSEEGVSRQNEIFTEMKYIHGLWGILSNRVSRKEQLQFEKDVAQILLDTNIFEFLKSVIELYQIETDNPRETVICIMAFSVLFNFTDSSEPLAIAVAKTKIGEVCKSILELFCKNHLEGNGNTELEEESVLSLVGLVHNLSMIDENVQRLRNLGFVEVLQPYMMKSFSRDVSRTCITTLANIVTEEECDIIRANVGSVIELIEVMANGIPFKTRRYDGWSCKECATAIRKLARNDANKHLLWILQAIPTLALLIKTGEEDEQLEGVLAIWALAFDEKIREDIIKNKRLDVVEQLIELKHTTHHVTLKDACERCLWTVREELKHSSIKKYNEAVEGIQSRPLPRDSDKHVMISYQRALRDILKKIRDKLKEQNYNVWMDVDQMGGCTLQAMANAIENACVVLICYSRNYKDSQYCQSEAEYAYNQKKTIIPLKMEEGYKPDGWLGLLLGEKYFVEFSGKYDFNDKLKDMFKEIRSALKEKPIDQKPAVTPDVQKVSRPILLNPPDEVDAAPRSKIKEGEKVGLTGKLIKVRQWTEVDVADWLTKHSLTNQGFDELSGEEISMLAKMQLEAPEQLHVCIRKDLKVKALRVKSRLIWALFDITNTDDHEYS